MRRLLTIGMNTIRGFANPAFNFLIVVFGVKVFGKADWASLINVMLWIFFVTFMMGWGNRDHLLRKYSQESRKMYHAFFSNFLSRSLLVPFAFLLLLFFPVLGVKKNVSGSSRCKFCLYNFCDGEKLRDFIV